MKKRRRARVEIPAYLNDAVNDAVKYKMTQTQEMILGGVVFCTGFAMLIATIIIFIVGSGAKL